jgi:hypothetical protein
MAACEGQSRGFGGTGCPDHGLDESGLHGGSPARRILVWLTVLRHCGAGVTNPGKLRGMSMAAQRHVAAICAQSRIAEIRRP